MQQEANSMLTICPSFSCYSSIATKVSEEINDKAEHFGFEKDKENDDNGFEFNCVFADHEALTISADEMFSNGKIRPIFPIFQQQEEDRKVVVKSTRHTLIKLLNEERESYACSSFSSESESIEEELVPGTFCVWKPKSDSENKKSSSSKRWKFKDLIQYGNTNSNSNESKESAVVLAPVSKSTKKGEKKIAGKKTGGEVVAVKSAHELHYVRNRELKEVDKRRSYLPYRKDLVGFFANVNGLSRHLQPL